MPNLRSIDKFGNTYRFFPLVIFIVPATIDHLHAAIIIERVLSADMAETPFKAVIKPSNLMPCAKIALEREIINRRDAGGCRHTTGQQRDQYRK